MVMSCYLCSGRYLPHDPETQNSALFYYDPNPEGVRTPFIVSHFTLRSGEDNDGPVRWTKGWELPKPRPEYHLWIAQRFGEATRV